jgi:hypothetical protein
MQSKSAETTSRKGRKVSRLAEIYGTSIKEKKGEERVFPVIWKP